MDIALNNGIHCLSGRIDEYASFDSLLTSAEPLKLHLGKVTSINSIGVRKFLAFALAWSPRRFEFFECTPEFITNVNVIPQMLGSSGDETQITSLYVPFFCEPCKRVENILFQRDQLKADASGDVEVAAKKCSKCGNPLDLDIDKSEYFTFLRGKD